MEVSPATTAVPSKSNKKASKNKKNRGKKETSSQDMDVSHNEDTVIPTNGHKDMNSENSSDGNDIQGADTESLRRDLEDEKARYRDQERKMEELSTSTATAEGASDRLKEETARAEKLEAEVQSLRIELANMSNTSKGSEAPQLEVLKLQNELEEVKEQRQKDKVEAENRIAEIQRQKDSVDAQYQSLLGRVTTIRTTLGERMKADAEELAQAKQTVEDLEEQNRSLNDTVDELSVELDKLRGEKNDASRELSSLRNRLNLAQQNWNKEREDLIKAERMTKEEYDVARQAMQDWEVIATEERAVRESLSDRVVELEEQLTTQKELYDRMAADYEKQGSSMKGLQRALQEIQDARKKELREIVENTQSQISALTTKCETLDKLAKEAESNLTAAKQDLERVLPFEKEVKEKNLLIGKLRHEAVTLNDHLRKALRMLKRDNADDKIDKQLVTNVFLQFVSLQRGDAKKYEVLQLIASVLDWNDEQREKAGLLRPGTAAQHTSSGFFSSSLKTPPLTPFHRSPSTPALNDAYGGDEKDIWRSVLDSEK